MCWLTNCVVLRHRSWTESRAKCSVTLSRRKASIVNFCSTDDGSVYQTESIEFFRAKSTRRCSERRAVKKFSKFRVWGKVPQGSDSISAGITRFSSRGSFSVKNQLGLSIRFDRTPACDRHRHRRGAVANTVALVKTLVSQYQDTLGQLRNAFKCNLLLINRFLYGPAVLVVHRI